jgi:hypothetical protein
MNPVNAFRSARRTYLRTVIGALAALAAAVACAAGTPPRPDESELLATGFKVLVATTSVQRDWVKSLPVGKIRAMQRNGKKYFVYPDAPGNQVYVGGPKEYQAYLERHPEMQQGTNAAANSAYRARQADAMRMATARDLSDPFLGASWADLGW